MGYDTTQTEQPVYVVYEYNEDGDDRLRHVFEESATTLKGLLDYYTKRAESDSEIVPQAFHAADPGDEHLRDGDFYLTKQHGVSISHGLVD